MYTSPVPRVRDEPAAYGPHEVDDDPFPAARVLDDLTRGPDDAVPSILARYAALRCWHLRARHAHPVLLDHAIEAARRYVAAIDGPEASALARVAARAPELDAFEDAASAAASAHHVEGAYALLHAGYATARQRSDLRWAARLAGALAVLLEAEGLDGVALWTRRADRIRRLIDRD